MIRRSDRVCGLLSRVTLVTVGTVISSIVWIAPAQADSVVGSGITYVGLSPSAQGLRWTVPGEEIRLWARFAATSTGSARYCHDAAVDWFTNGTGHYDARVIRNCNPGTTIETDPGGNGFWQEPNNYDEADVTRVQRAGSYAFPDDDLSNVVQPENIHGGAPSNALATSNYSQRIRTMYDSGLVQSFEHFPVRCSNNDTWVPNPFNNSGACR